MNGDVEVFDKGEPIGWKYNSAFPLQNQENCSVGSPGFQSDHALIMSLRGLNAQAGWNGLLHNIKPHAKYVLSFWYRLPEKGEMEVNVFGKRLSVTKMFRYNPMHWLRYSAIVDSGDTVGDAKIVFVPLKGTGPFMFWVDQVELYEGESAIGKNCARLEYQYYNVAYVSQDVVSPLPFAFEWTFDVDKKPGEIQYVVELPSEVELVNVALGRMCKWPKDGWKGTWTRPDYSSKVETQQITVNDKPYIRVIAHVPYVKGDEKQFTNYVVPVGIRDYWGETPGRYSGMVSMTMYVRARASKGSFPFYYYAKWDNGQEKLKKLNMEITDIKKVKQPEKLLLISDVQMQAGDKNPALGEDFRHIGLNGIGNLDMQGGNETLKGKIEALRKNGMKYFSNWMNIASYGASDEKAKAMDINGKRTGEAGWCLSYRGPDWTKKMVEYKKKLGTGINFFAFDDASPGMCYCDKCKHTFEEFFRKHSKLPYIDPAIFMKQGWGGNAEYKILWNDFVLWHYGKTAQDMKDELVQHAKRKKLNADILFGVSSWLPFDKDFAAETIKAFDFDIRQTYINWAESGFGGSPKLVGDSLYHSQMKLGNNALPLAPTLSPGLTYMHPACALDPYSQMKYQIMEAMMAPKFAGYYIYDGKDIDLGDMKYMAEANALMVRFEKIIRNGKAEKPIGIDRWSGVRIKTSGEEGLVLVSDYSTYEPVGKGISFSSPILSGHTLIDVETNETIKPINGIYSVKISETRARLFHFGKP
ncbi:MAG: hypothetical protein NTX75_03955 [Proteobacteria bacterium]|nr:hypothetical protein [Pseudomonadota bacterium]